MRHFDNLGLLGDLDRVYTVIKYNVAVAYQLKSSHITMAMQHTPSQALRLAWARMASMRLAMVAARINHWLATYSSE